MGVKRSLFIFDNADPVKESIYFWGGGADVDSFTANPEGDGQWHMYTITHDGAGKIRLYLDGSELGTGTPTGPLADLLSPNIVELNPRSGWDVDTVAEYDEFTIWSGRLTGEEITGLFTQNSAEPTAVLSLVATPPAVASGGSAQLSWQVQNADSVRLNGGAFSDLDVTALSQIDTGALAADATFTLTATDLASGISASAEVTVGVDAVLADPLITEFMAVNDSTLADEDGDYSDWIEIHNPNAYGFEIGGWFLTDDAANLAKWQIPAGVQIPAGGYLIVFASDKNRGGPGAELHANFKLTGDGEYLALVKPDGSTVAQEFAPAFPPQSADLSYGIGNSPVAQSLAAAGAAADVMVPGAATGPALGSGWVEPGYVQGTNGESWASAQTGIGFDVQGDFDGLIGAGGNLQAAMLNTATSAYLRLPFDVADPGSLEFFRLAMRYDDGFVAYLNGTEVARQNLDPNSGSVASAILNTSLSPGSGLVAYYSFDGNVEDGAGAAPNGSSTADDDFAGLAAAGALAIGYEPGVSGSAVKIGRGPGEPAILVAPDSADLRLGAAWTLEAFVKPDSNNTGDWDRFITKWFDGSTEWHWAFRTANNGQDLFLNNANFIAGASTPTVPLNEWTHVALTCHAARGIEVWQNGERVATAPYVAVNQGISQMRIGNATINAGDAGLQFSGLVDEFAIWNVALTEPQIAAHAAALNAVAWDARALVERDKSAAIQPVSIDLTAERGLLQPGANLLAIQALNADAADGDLLALPELEGGTLVLDPGTRSYFASPTPGGKNAAGTNALGPAVAGQPHSPNVPTAAEPISVSATAEATNAPVAAMELVYRVMYGPEITVPMAAGGGGQFSGQIPAGAAAPGEMVRWYFRATDTGGNSSRDPAFIDPNNAPEYYGTVIADPSVATPLPVIHRFVQNPAAAETDAGTRCSIFYNGEFYDNAFVRIRGGTARAWPKKSYKVEFNDGFHFRFRDDLPRVDEFNLNTVYTDKSYNRAVLTYEFRAGRRDAVAGDVPRPPAAERAILQRRAFRRAAGPRFPAPQRHGPGRSLL
ncbi:MAG: LamG-like jellyroll fold domain-containing protein [Verrucomicrobiales bacterium]